MSNYQTNSQSEYQGNTSSYTQETDGRPAGCCGRGCCWWGRKKLGLE